MNITGKTMIFRKDFDGRPSYSGSISSKDMNGNWISVIVPVQMPKGTDLPNKTEIDVTKGFEAVYVKRDGTKDRKIVVMEYETDLPTGFAQVDDSEIPF
jgi:hypothetical protein